jgi:PadR family transcriptional regulator PadR
MMPMKKIDVATIEAARRGLRGHDGLRHLSDPGLHEGARHRLHGVKQWLAPQRSAGAGEPRELPLQQVDLRQKHGFGLAKRILQVSDGVLNLNQGTLYPALLRLGQRRWIRSRWGVSENNRKAKFYELTSRGRKQIAEETDSWELTVSVMTKFLAKPEVDL